MTKKINTALYNAMIEACADVLSYEPPSDCDIIRKLAKSVETNIEEVLETRRKVREDILRLRSLN